MLTRIVEVKYSRMLKFMRSAVAQPYVMHGKCAQLNPARQFFLSAFRKQEAAVAAKNPSDVSAASAPGAVTAFRSKYFAPTGLVPMVEDDPARDLKNYPRQLPRRYAAQHKFWFFPKSWFDALYAKTGVSGPYVFGGGLVAFLLSKEIWILEHEANTMIPLIALCVLAKKYIVPSVHEFIETETDKDEKKLIQYQDDAMQFLEDEILIQDNRIVNADASKHLFEAKKENVLLQMESEYRKRLSEAYDSTKKRLDYFVAVQNSKRRYEREHMLDWIVSGVKNSITEASEKDNMKQCVARLNTLSVAK